jgi:hypothetical protein
VSRGVLPFGSEFSPSQIDLSYLLELAVEFNGDWRSFQASVRTMYFEDLDATPRSKNKLANNTTLAMMAYGLIDGGANLTEIGQKLYSLRTNSHNLYVEFARHILTNLFGTALIQCIHDMQADGEEIKLSNLREWLEERGIIFPRRGKHPSIMRLWLEKADVFHYGWQINEFKLKEMLEHSSEELESLSAFNHE